MNISVVIIAHNEEAWIERCITSIVPQAPAEIIIVAHNCTDRTVELAKKYPVKVIECTGDGGPIYARMVGIKEAVGDIIVCTDGDAWVGKNWISEIVKPLNNPAVSIVAGYTTIMNNMIWKLSSWWQFVINRKFLNKQEHRFAWGSNMAFRKADYEKVGGLEKFLDVYQQVGVKLYAEDLYISLALQKIGKFTVALGARVCTYLPSEKASLAAQRRIVSIQQQDNAIIRKFLNI